VALTPFSRDRPAVQSLYVDLLEAPGAPPQPIHLGFWLGANHLRACLESPEGIGVNPVALDLRFNQADMRQH